MVTYTFQEMYDLLRLSPKRPYSKKKAIRVWRRNARRQEQDRPWTPPDQNPIKRERRGSLKPDREIVTTETHPGLRTDWVIPPAVSPRKATKNLRRLVKGKMRKALTTFSNEGAKLISPEDQRLQSLNRKNELKKTQARAEEKCNLRILAAQGNRFDKRRDVSIFQLHPA